VVTAVQQESEVRAALRRSALSPGNGR